ncbi:MAG: hypothetical protein HOK35_15950 [Cytophagia bacterium]|nr:hypothetical protein [Cytophagia bacterium]
MKNGATSYIITPPQSWKQPSASSFIITIMSVTMSYWTMLRLLMGTMGDVNK